MTNTNPFIIDVTPISKSKSSIGCPIFRNLAFSNAYKSKELKIGIIWTPDRKSSSDF